MSHLYHFCQGRKYYELPDEEDDFSRSEDITNFKIKDLLSEVGNKLSYEYDFGDGWVHKIVEEKIE